MRDEANPRCQCDKCGQWKRVEGIKNGRAHQYMWPVGVDQDWCDVCCDKPANLEEYIRLQLESKAITHEQAAELRAKEAPDAQA